jgi:hypothetical protein
MNYYILFCISLLPTVFLNMSENDSKTFIITGLSTYQMTYFKQILVQIG